MNTLEKHAADHLFATVDWAQDLDTGETLSSAVWTVGSPLVKESQSESGNVATAVISGGTAENTYHISVLLTSSAGRKTTVVIPIFVKETVALT